MITMRWLIVLALAAPSGIERVSAECKGPGTVCAEYENATAVFVGRVVQVTPDAEDRQIGPLPPQVVAFDVSEDFKGTAGSAILMKLDQTVPDTRLFTLGETVLVYARRYGTDPITWSVVCTRTRRVTAGDLELNVLRQLQAGFRGGAIEGTLQLPANARPPAAAPTVDLANLPLSLQPMDGSETIVILSQPSGYFQFPWVKPGTYRLRFDAPAFASAVRDVVIGDKGQCVTLEPIAVRPR